MVWYHLGEAEQGLDWKGKEPDYLAVFFYVKGDENKGYDGEDGCVGEEEFN